MKFGKRRGLTIRLAQGGDASIRTVIIAKMPAPYRVRVFDIISGDPDIDLTVIYMSSREPNRDWEILPGKARSVFLRPRFWTVRDRYIHANFSIIRELRQAKPQVVVTSGYNVTDILAILYCVLHKAHHVSQTDGTYESEKVLGRGHRLVRKMVRRVTAAYVGPSDGSIKLFESFGADPLSIFKAPLAVDNAAFAEARERSDQVFDLLFSSRLTEVKNPIFAIDVAVSVSRTLGRKVRMAILGSGELQEQVNEYASVQRQYLEVDLPGFIQQADLPSWYCISKVFLFPTSWDPWGVVINEACAAGLPVLTTPAAGAVGELVVDGSTGHVLPLDVEKWAACVVQLLNDSALYDQFSRAAVDHVSPFTYESAAEGYLNAIHYAVQR